MFDEKTVSRIHYQAAGANPAVHAENVVKSDVNTFSPIGRSLRVASPGAVQLTLPNSDTVNFLAVAAGETIPCYFTRVNSTFTTASGFVVYY